MKIKSICGLVALALSTSIASAANVVVHEWGTFTSFQDEQGRSMNYINTDDEPVPAFVHQIGRRTVIGPTEVPFVSPKAPQAMQGVTMRLETPVLYFHLPPGESATVDVKVEFRGGWLTQFYPDARATVNGVSIPVRDGGPRANIWGKGEDSISLPPLADQSYGELTWKGVKVGTDAAGPVTKDHVWTAPRDVVASGVTVGKESEKFLFYRGIGKHEAPLSVSRRDGNFHIAANDAGLGQINAMNIPNAWLVDIRPDGATAFRGIDPFEVSRGANEIAQTPAEFADAEHSSGNLDKLRGEMRQALVGQGLNSDEADALLNTWQLSYFQAPGLRMFFIVPQEWTNAVLPIRISGTSEIRRAMVGRIELVTPRQRQLLKEIAAAPVPNLKDLTTAMWKLRGIHPDEYNAIASGRKDGGAIGVAVPEAYRKYLELGRFRVSLLMNAGRDGDKSLAGLSDFMTEIQQPGKGVAQQMRQRRSAQQAKVDVAR